MPNVNDPNNDRSRLESRIEELEALPDEDQELLEYWLENYRDSNADSTTLGHLGHLLTIQEELDTSLSEASKFTWTSAISALENERGWTSGTKRNWQKSVRSFLEEIKDDVSASKDDINLAKDDSGGKISEDDILSINEVRILIQEASNRVRDQAMFSVLIDLGLRVSAVCSLRVGDFEYEEGDSVAEVTLNSDALGQKGSGGRTHVATFSAGYIRSYLRSEHPRPDNGNAPLFHKIGRHYSPDDPTDDGSISPPIFRRRMKRLARDTDIDKSKLHPHNMKHAAVTIWALRGMSDREIEYRAGWARESGQLKRYEHLTGDDINNQILETFGVERAESDPVIVAPIDNCPNCKMSIDTGMRYCPQCGQQVEQDTAPEWYEILVEELGNDDELVESLRENPSMVSSDPADLPQTILDSHQETIERVLGQSITYGLGPLHNYLEKTVPAEDGDGEVLVHLSYDVMQQVEPEDLSARQTDDGTIELFDADGNVVDRHDPIKLDG